MPVQRSDNRFSLEDATLPVVFVHVYYLEVWTEIAQHLSERLRMPFRLVLTTSLTDELPLPTQTPYLMSVKVMRVENRGRDILPFLAALAETKNFDIALKLHTKKSPQRDDGLQWRQKILASLLPSPSQTTDIVNRMRADPRIGLVAPDLFSLSVKPWVLENWPTMCRLMGALGHQLESSDLDGAYFAAGSMFWFRKSALETLADGRLSTCFETETGQTDGTAAHAIERLFGVEVHRGGFVGTSIAALRASNPAMADEELNMLARRYADRPSRYFVHSSPQLRFISRYVSLTSSLHLRRLYLSLPSFVRLLLRKFLMRI